MKCTDPQKAVVFLTSLPVGLAAEVASHLTVLNLRRLSESAASLPDVDTETRSSILKEIQTGVSTPLASLASKRPFEVARHLENKWLGGSRIRLELGSELHRAVQGKSSRYSYLSSLRSKAVWWYVDGPHRNDDLPANGFLFSEQGEPLEQGTLELNEYFVLDPEGPHEYGGCRFQKTPEDGIRAQDSWRGTGLNPADILAWYSRVLSSRRDHTLSPAPAGSVYEFLSVAKERTARKSPNMEWVRAAETTQDWGEPSLALLLTESTQDMGYHRAAVLFCCLQLHPDHREQIFKKLTLEESKGILRALTRVEESRSNFDSLTQQLALLGIGPTRDLSDLVAGVVKGRRLPIKASIWQAIIVRSLHDRERYPVMEAVLDRLSDNAQKEFMAAYSAVGLRTQHNKINSFVVNNFVSEMMEPALTAELECQRLVMKNPVEAALAFKRLTAGSWVVSRLRSWARGDLQKAAEKIASARPGILLTEAQVSSALFGRLAPTAGALLRCYLTALGVTVTKDEPGVEVHGPTILAAYHSVLKEQHEDGGQYQLSGS